MVPSEVRSRAGQEGPPPVPAFDQYNQAALCFTDVVRYGEGIKRVTPRWMRREGKKRMKSQKTAQVRATISFPPDLYETLEELAKQKKVSLAWVVREASEKYIAAQKSESGK